jgi:K+-sensing histidine kinase KdpD
MRMQIFDYIFKPFDTLKFRQSVKAALDFAVYKNSQKERSQQISMNLRSQLEWLNYKEHRRQLESTSQEKNLLYNLKTSMSQGAGIGALISILELAEGMLVRNGDTCTFPCSLAELVFTNMNISKRMIDGIISISDILDAKTELSPGQTSDIKKIIEEKAEILADVISAHNIKFSISELSHDEPVNINVSALENIFEELLINALKYSPKDGELSVIFHYSEGYFVVAVKNDINVTSGGKGVLPENERLVIEPFIRFAIPEESIALREKYSIGLGLSVVDHVARVHGGQFFIRNVIDHIRKYPVTCVIAEFLIPVIQNQESHV